MKMMERENFRVWEFYFRIINGFKYGFINRIICLLNVYVCIMWWVYGRVSVVLVVVFMCKSYYFWNFVLFFLFKIFVSMI